MKLPTSYGAQSLSMHFPSACTYVHNANSVLCTPASSPTMRLPRTRNFSGPICPQTDFFSSLTRSSLNSTLHCGKVHQRFLPFGGSSSSGACFFFPCQRICQSAWHITHMRRTSSADSICKSWPGACMPRTASGLQPSVDLCSPILRGGAGRLCLHVYCYSRNICTSTQGRQPSVRYKACGKDAALAAPHAQQTSAHLRLTCLPKSASSST